MCKLVLHFCKNTSSLHCCLYMFSLTDPPKEVQISAPIGGEIINLHKGFGEHVLNISAESDTAISCNSVKITWMSRTKGNILSCEAEGKKSHNFNPYFNYSIKINAIVEICYH